MKLSTLRKIVLGYIAAVPILIVITILQFMSVQGVVEAYRREGRAYDIIRQSDALTEALGDIDASFRNFLKDRKSEELKPYQDAPARTRELLDSLIMLTEGDGPQQSRVKQIEAGVSTRLDLYRKQLETQPVTLAPSARSAAPPPPNEAQAEGEKTSVDLASLLAALRREESNRLPALAAASRAGVSRANKLAPIVGMLCIWMVLLAALLLYRDTTRRAYAGIERRMQTRIVEMLPLGTCLVDEDGLVLYTNAAQDSLFGYEPGGLVGRHVTSLHSNPRGEGDEVFDGAMAELRSQGAWRGNFVARRKNLTTFNCLSQAVPVDMSGKSYRLFLMASGASEAASET